MRNYEAANVQEAVEREPGRGRDAASPGEIPRKGLLDALWRIKNDVLSENMPLIAAGVAFYGLLAIFPAITALMAIAGLVYKPVELVNVFRGASAVVPPDVSDILINQAQAVASADQGGLTFGVVLGVSLAFWSASTGVGSLVQGLNVAYGERETRSFVWLRLRTLAMTVAMMVGLIVAAALIVVVPIVLAFAVISPQLATLVQLVAYVPLALIFILGVTALYRWGPDRKRAKWRWLSPGAIFASVLWLFASIGFSIYVQTFGSYNETFGSLGGVIVLLMWLWISALVVLLGAKLNAELEAQTARDTTIGPREPMGFRGAVKADRLGDAR